MAIGVGRLAERDASTRFRYLLDGKIEQEWWRDIVFDFDSTQPLSETHDWIGGLPGMTERTGDDRTSKLRVNQFTIRNVPWQTAVEIEKSRFKHSKGGSLYSRVGEFSTVAAAHPGVLTQQLMLAGDSTACYDGFNFFDTSHAEGSSGVQSNLFTIPVENPVNPPTQSMVDALVYGITQMMCNLDDQGNECNLSAKKFKAVVPKGLFPALLNALGAQLMTAGNTNIIANGSTFNISFQLAPRMSGNIVQIYRRDEGNGNAFIWQVLDPVMPYELGLDSEYCRHTGNVEFGMDGAYNIGYGRWQHAAQITFVAP